MYNAYNEDCRIEGSHLDDAYYSGMALLREWFPDTSVQLLGDWERLYNIVYQTVPDTTTRQGAVLAAVRARGGLSRAYLISLGTAMGYTCTITEASATVFIVASTTPPATQIPAQLYNPYTQYGFTYTITSGTPVPELEALVSDLRPAWTMVTFLYI